MDEAEQASDDPETGIEHVDPDDTDRGAAEQRRGKDDGPCAVTEPQWLVEQQGHQQPEDHRATDRSHRVDKCVQNNLVEDVVVEQIAKVLEADELLHRCDQVPAVEAEPEAVDDGPEGKDGEKEEIWANEKDKQQPLAARESPSLRRTGKLGVSGPSRVRQ